MTRILVVDDVEQNRYLLVSLLRGNGFEVDAAGNGVEALEHARRCPPDLVITDLLMPVMDGFELCRRWKKTELLERIPFLVYTATYTDRADEELAISLGADRFLVKPQEVGVLLDAVRDLLGRSAEVAVPAAGPEDDEQLLIAHNKVLLGKLQQKVQALELEVADRKRAEDERLALQSQLLAAQRMESLGRLAGGVAHDFNNLLSVIILCAEAALDEVPANAAAHELIEEIRSAGERAASLTRQLLAFGRKQLVEPEVLDLNQTVATVETMLRRLLGETIELVVHRAPDLGKVLADPGQLEQIIMNLAVNARDAMPSGGTLRIETANVELDDGHSRGGVSVPPGRYVVLSVADSGVGMDTATLERIFDPFFTTKERGKGTGLGLSIVYGVVKQSDGHVCVESTPGHGAAFAIYLPRVDREATVAPQRPATSLATGSETVLVVEDDEAVRRVAARILRRAGYRVEVAPNGVEALRVAGGLGDELSLLLTDLVMPGMSGPDLARQLREARPGLRTLYTSGYSDDTLEAGSIPAGARFVGKPFSATGLAHKVREALDAAPPDLER